MGGALALGCGGESQRTTNAPEGTAGMGTDGAGGGSGKGALAGGAGAPLAGTGSIIVSSGGSPAIGGSPAGGSPTTVGAAGAAPLPDCLPAQWTCPQGFMCDGVSLPSATTCTCDSTRPKTAADCADDESFVCIAGLTYDASGNAVEPPVPYQCQCVPRQADCASACRSTDSGRYVRCITPDPPSNPSDPILCECAPVVLK
jgi:hypothetical protein